MNFCDGLDIKLTSPLGGLQSAGVPETAAQRFTTLQTRYNADVEIHNIRPRYTEVFYYVTNGIHS